MPTLQDVANEAGVSVATASRVLNGAKHNRRISGAARERVRLTAERLGYRAAYHRRSINRGRSDTLGVALDVHAPVEPPGPPSVLSDVFFTRLLAGVEQATHRVGLNLSLIVPSQRQRAGERGLSQMQEGRLDGLVVLPSTAQGRLDETCAALAQQNQHPAVVGVYIDGPRPYASISADPKAAVRLLMQHLAELGHRELLWFGPADRHGDQAPPSAREQAFLASAFELGMSGRLVRYPWRTAGQHADSEAVADEREAVLAAFLDQEAPRFTAVVAYNDAAAISAIRVLQRRDLAVPRDVSVVGVDNLDASANTLRLTTVDQRLEDMGRLAGEWLGELLDAAPDARGQLARRHTSLAPTLHVRESSGPAPTPSNPSAK
ncbi:MAG: LacI family DNA-binding transcriptional regulator [Planctomycetota bacterium]